MQTGQMELQEVQILKEKKEESDTEQLRRAAAEHNLERMKICNLSGAGKAIDTFQNLNNKIATLDFYYMIGGVYIYITVKSEGLV